MRPSSSSIASAQINTGEREETADQDRRLFLSDSRLSPGSCLLMPLQKIKRRLAHEEPAAFPGGCLPKQFLHLPHIPKNTKAAGP